MNKADLTRWSWVEIDRGALRRNTRAYKNLLDPRQRLCCVVKADAYGHGVRQDHVFGRRRHVCRGDGQRGR